MLFIKPKIKVALCISGQMRNYEHLFPNLEKHIIQPFKPDIFIHTWDKRGCSIVLTKRTDEELKKKQDKWDKEFNETVTVENLNALYQPKNIVVEEFLEEYKCKIENVTVPEWMLKHYNGRTEGTVGDGNKWATCHIHSFLPMFYKIYKCNEMKCDQEKLQGFDYDMVIRFRTDLIVGEIPDYCLNHLDRLWCNINIGSPPLPNSKNNNSYLPLKDKTVSFWRDKFPTGQSQVSDRYAFSNSRNMNIYSSVFKELSVYWADQKDRNPQFDSWDFPVGDRLLRKHLMNMSLDHSSFEPFAPIYR